MSYDKSNRVMYHCSTCKKFEFAVRKDFTPAAAIVAKQCVCGSKMVAGSLKAKKKK